MYHGPAGFQPTLIWLWLDQSFTVWPAKTHSRRTNCELCMDVDGDEEGESQEKWDLIQPGEEENSEGGT